MFGKLFNDIYIMRKDASDTGYSTLKVPLAYAPRRKFIERIRENPNLDTDTQVAIKLPRMSFEIVSFNYDPNRQISKTTTFSQAASVNTQRNKFRAWVPYTINFQLSIYAKTHDDALQVVEQIVPYFNPQYTLTVKPFEEYPNVTEDVPVTLTGISFTDDYEAALEQRRTIIYTLDFDMKINFWGPIGNATIIRKAINKIYEINQGGRDSDVLIETITVTPDPADASPDSDYGFNTVIDLAFDDSA